MFGWHRHIDLVFARAGLFVGNFDKRGLRADVAFAKDGTSAARLRFGVLAVLHKILPFGLCFRLLSYGTWLLRDQRSFGTLFIRRHKLILSYGLRALALVQALLFS